MEFIKSELETIIAVFQRCGVDFTIEFKGGRLTLRYGNSILVFENGKAISAIELK